MERRLGEATRNIDESGQNASEQRERTGGGMKMERRLEEAARYIDESGQNAGGHARTATPRPERERARADSTSESSHA